MELYLIRGLPGSGKSTLGAKIATVIGGQQFEADQYFYKNGIYTFDRGLLGEAHRQCQENTLDCLNSGLSAVVCNTFTTIKELKPYFQIAKDLGIVPTVIHCQNEFGSIHSVPPDAMLAMKNRFCHDIRILFEESV